MSEEIAAAAIIHELQQTLRESQERERVAAEAYNGQQQSYRELETLYQAAQERASKADAVYAELAAARALIDHDRVRPVQLYSEAWFAWRERKETLMAAYDKARGRE